LVGQSFDDVELLAELGRGGMGIVYKARQKSLDRLVAVKLLLAEYYQDPTRLARFLAEARAAASLVHPNIVQVYQVGQCPFGHYFAMEYVHGRSLEHFIAKGNIPLASTVTLLETIARSVEFAHSKGIIHRDLKPANIMVDKSRRPVVMDFGIAKVVGKTSSLTQEGAIMGTPAFMAPEQAGESPDEVGPWSDVYSLGAILYTMLTGRVPYDEGTALRTILKVIGPEMPPKVRSLRPQVPPELERICMKCLSKHAADRYATAAALADELQAALAQPRSRRGEDTIKRRGAPPPTMAARLPSLILVSVKTGKRLRITQTEAIVGRASDCDVVLRANDISKRHCRLLLDDDGARVQDLDSANGIAVNGDAVQESALQNGDRLRIADHEFVVELDLGS
jgi:serine/threonine-protein kinase